MRTNRKISSITFGELTENLTYIKIIYNGEVIYDNMTGEETLEHLTEVGEKYNDKIVYEMNIKICQFHHCILTIEGEPV